VGLVSARRPTRKQTIEPRCDRRGDADLDTVLDDEVITNAAERGAVHWVMKLMPLPTACRSWGHAQDVA
jgi:hypothetical protein